jgi:crotonobetaine/carnitine-CoA ligase
MFWQEVKDSRSTILLVHDQPLLMLLKQPEGPLDRSHGARLVHPGFRMQRQFHERFGVDVVSGIASNEGQTVAWAPWYRPHVDPNYYDSESPGLEILSDYCEVRIVDDDDKEVARGETGEITSRYKQPHMQFEGYYNDPDKTAEVFRGGWYHHGDLGRIDEKGLLHFAGRKAESIRHRGEWIARELVENAANAHPLVKESVLVGVPSGLGDEDLKLYVVPKGPTPISPPDLLDHLAGSLPYFMIPRYVESIESLPRTPGLEKIRWRDLSSLGVGSAWDRRQAGYKIKRRTHQT